MKLLHIKGVVTYANRDSFVTDALGQRRGHRPGAEVLGHTSTDMVMRHYQHLRKKREHLKQAAVQATRRNGQQADLAPKAG